MDIAVEHQPVCPVRKRYISEHFQCIRMAPPRGVLRPGGECLGGYDRFPIHMRGGSHALTPVKLELFKWFFPKLAHRHISSRRVQECVERAIGVGFG